MKHFCYVIVIILSIDSFIKCQTTDCLNGGVLVTRPTATIERVCICNKNFIGPRCETRLDTLSVQEKRKYGCELRPCWIGSTCEDRDGSFVCHCSANTFGEFCERSSLTNNDPCISKPCYNGGQCVQQDQNSYTCNCNGSFGGLSCKNNLVGACASNPCQREGICVPIGLTDYRCQCPEWTIGKNCEVVFNPCQRVNCMNNGNCLRRRTLAYECNCTADYTGLLCNQPLYQSCRSVPCAYGSCQLGVSGQYECVCNTPGYEGPFCEIERCNPGCKNGYCNRDSAGTYYCECSSSYKGPSCSDLVCFSGNSLVETRDRGVINISDIKKDDYLKTYDTKSKEWKYSRFIAYLHMDSKIMGRFVNIKTDKNKSLTVSRHHFVARIKQNREIEISEENIEFIFAKDLKTNDILISLNENKREFERIIEIETVYEQGAFAPLTEEGTLMVNSLYVSCYANTIVHDLAHFLFQPIIKWSVYFRDYFDMLFYRLFTDVQIDETHSQQEGIYWYAKMFLNLLPFIPFASNVVFF